MQATRVKERPLLMRPYLANRSLEGKKTETRRVITPQPTLSENVGFCWKNSAFGVGFSKYDTAQNFAVACPLGRKGHHLWVRERAYYDKRIIKDVGSRRVFFEDSGDMRFQKRPGVYPTPYKLTRELAKLNSTLVCRPSILMPRWASRLIVVIEHVGVERIQEITDESALKEGISEVTKDGKLKKYCVIDQGDLSSTPWQDMARTPREAFRLLWDKINKKRGFGWDKNPWVWVVRYKKSEEVLV